MARISRIETLRNRIYLWNLRHLWEIFKYSQKVYGREKQSPFSQNLPAKVIFITFHEAPIYYICWNSIHIESRCASFAILIVNWFETGPIYYPQFLLAFPFLTKGWIWLDFKINQDFIAKTLCINKDKPETKCNGKCHLKKQLKKEEAKEPTQLPSTKREVVEMIGVENTFSLRIDILLNNHPANRYDENLYSFMFMNDVWHPPKYLWFNIL